MTRVLAVFAWVSALLVAAPSPARAQDSEKPMPVYIWLEPEWFEGVEGGFAYWPGPESSKPTGKWGIAGPGISAEWTQGGESEWNSIGVPAAETQAVCSRRFMVPFDGRFKVWVRYVDHRQKIEPFRVRVTDVDGVAGQGELGVFPAVPPNDEYQLYWGFSFGWQYIGVELSAGPATLELIVERPGEAWRQIDAVLITDNLDYEPVGREKPPFAYLAQFDVRPTAGTAFRGSGQGLAVGGQWARPAVGGRDFSMWTGVGTDPPWWSQQNPDALTLADVHFEFAAPQEIREAFKQRFGTSAGAPLINWPDLLPGLYLGEAPDLSPGTPLRQWLERTRTPFYIMTNYANPVYSEQTGPATYQALVGPLKDQFVGYIHGEAMGTLTVSMPTDGPRGKDRREHIDAIGQAMKEQQAAEWSRFYKTEVPQEHWNQGIACLSCDSIALAHLFHETGRSVVGYELDATNLHAPMRIAFERGAARQYGGAWINYASSNFGDACNYFLQDPVVPRGAKGWWHSKYAVTDGVSAAWYRRFYYLNYLSGASAIYWEQNLANQWIKPGPGEHPVQFSPFGRATEDFQQFVSRLPDRGEPYTPVAFLLDYGHSYERVNYHCKMLGVWPENAADLELRELFNVAWHPTAINEGRPQMPDLQSMPDGVYGNIFDVLVDRPARARAIMNYPVVWAAGDVVLDERWVAVLEEYLENGGTLVVNVEAVRNSPALKLTGLRLRGETGLFEGWRPAGAEADLPSTPYETHLVELAGAQPLAWADTDVPLMVRHAVGQGAVVTTLVPRMLGLDERAHPATPFLMNGLTEGLLPVEVLLADGSPATGQIMYQVNRTKDGWLVALLNNRGIDKTQHGVARVDRTQVADLRLRVRGPVQALKEYTQPRNIGHVTTEDPQGIYRVRVHPGDVQVVGIITE